MKVINLIQFVLVGKTVSSLLLPLTPELESEYLYFKDECVCGSGDEQHINNAIKKTHDYIEKTRIAENVPGIVAGISIKGKQVWIEAFGRTDIENDVKTHKDSVWRMASISKSLTTTLVAKLVESGKIDFDQSIDQYLKHDIFPVKQWNHKNVKITVKQVMSHTAGLRVSKFPQDLDQIHHYNNVTQTLKQFKDEPLINEPGSQFNYSNYGWQIIGAIIESVLNETYDKAINRMFFNELGMTSTYAEKHDMIIPHRAHYYMKNNSTKELLNADIVDDLVSYELMWPAGGIVSTLNDLLKFGNYMLNSYKGITDTKSGYLKSSTVRKLWTPNTPLLLKYSKLSNISSFYYGEGWFITNVSQPIVCNACKTPPIKSYVWHSGGITGVTTLLAIFPEQEFVVSVLTNLGTFGQIHEMVLNIAKNFI